MGERALDACTTGTDNTAVGCATLTSLTTAHNCTAIGRGALNNNTTGTNNIALGRNSGSDAVHNVTTSSNRMILGYDSITNTYIKVSLTVTSDQRDKTEIADLTRGLSFINQLRPVSYKFNKSREEPTVATGNKRYGFLAQEVLALEGSDPVIIDNEDTENLKYQGEALVPVLVKAVQELKAELDAAKARITELES